MNERMNEGMNERMNEIIISHAIQNKQCTKKVISSVVKFLKIIAI